MLVPELTVGCSIAGPRRNGGDGPIVTNVAAPDLAAGKMPDSPKHTSTELRKPGIAGRRPAGAEAVAPSAATAAPGRQPARLVLAGALAMFSLSVLAAAGLFLLGGDDDPADAAPISILPVQPAGVTILAKQPEPGGRNPSPAAPTAGGAATPSGFAMELGAALSFAELSARFALVSRQNAEVEFDRLEPRATLRDTDNGLEARLLVGPFGSAEAAGQTCGQIALPAGIECRAVPFEGELIARE